MLVGLSKESKKILADVSLGALQSIFCLIPGCSAFLGAWEGYQKNRLEEFVNELSKIVEGIEENKLDVRYIESEEFFDLIQKCFRIRMQHRSKLKAKYINNMLKESISIDRDIHFDTSIKEVFLTMLEQMSDAEQLFLSSFANGDYKNKSREDIYQQNVTQNSIALDLLYAKGILKDEDTWVKYIKGSILCDEFIAYIQALAKHEM